MLESYGVIGVVAGVAQVVYLTAAFVLSGHLLNRARRNRELAPLLLGIQLLFAMGFGYLLSGAGMAIAMVVENPSPRLVAALLGAGYLTTTFGLGAALAFNWRVFWPDRRWPLGLAAFLFGVMGVGWVGGLATGAFETGSYASGWMLLLHGGMLVTNLWGAFEPLRYHAKLEKRIRLGLAEPVVVDRFLLWGLGSLARAALVLVGPIAEWMLGDIHGSSRLSFSAGGLAAASLLGLATSLAYWLTFNPTAAYVRWVERRYRGSRV